MALLGRNFFYYDEFPIAGRQKSQLERKMGFLAKMFAKTSPKYSQLTTENEQQMAKAAATSDQRRSLLLLFIQLIFAIILIAIFLLYMLFAAVGRNSQGYHLLFHAADGGWRGDYEKQVGQYEKQPNSLAVPCRKLLYRQQEASKDDFCQWENMVYRTVYRRPDANSSGQCELIKAKKKFNCSLLWILQKFGVDNFEENEIEMPPMDSEQKVFVLASDANFFPSLKATIYDIKKLFGRRQKIVAYDLGGISNNKDMMAELDKVCNLEWRRFDFSLLPEDVRHLRAFAWKIQSFNEHNTIIYADTSVRFKRLDGLELYLKLMGNGSIAPVQMPSDPGHDIKFATDPRMYEYIPHFWDYIDMEKYVTMREAGFTIFHRSDYTRKLLKWALLCASTRECIDPVGMNLYCPTPFKGRAKCHRQDQSLLSILRSNMDNEMALTETGSSKSHNENPKLPEGNFFEISRGSKLDGKVDFVTGVMCEDAKN